MKESENHSIEQSDAIKLALYIRRKYFSYKKNTDGKVISPIKLQKSLYFLFAYWGLFIRENKENRDSVEVDYSTYCEYLYNDKIEAWTYGPVIPSVFIAEKEGELENLTDKHYAEDYLEDDSIKKEIIDNLLDQIFDIDDFSLVRISHEDMCWKKNYVETDLKHNREISKEEIIDEYISKKIG